MRHLFYILAFVCIPFGAVAQTQEEQDKGYIASLIEDNLSGVSREVNIIGFAGALSSEATIDVLTIADAEGVWLTLEDITLIWNRSGLLRGAIDVEEISAERIIVARAPISEDTGPAAEATPFSLPELPVSISLGQLDIAQIELGESFLGEPITISLKGTAQLSDGEGSANVIAERLNDKTGRFEIDGSYVNETKVLGMLLKLDEGPDGIAARVLDLPGRPAIGLQIEGNAPINDFAATLAIATDGQDRLNGTFGLTSDGAESLVRLDIGGDVRPLFDPAYQGFFGDDASLFAQARRTTSGRIEVSALDLTSQRLNLKGALVVGAQGWPELIDLTGGITPDGQPVLLPISGPETYVSGVDLAINYDGSQSDDWRTDIAISDFERPGLSIDTLDLKGGGILRDGEGDKIGVFSANLDYGARGMQLDDTGSARALGDAVTGTFVARRTEGEPTEITRLTLTGAGIDLAADAVIQGPSNGLRTDANVTLSVAALGRFSTLVGQNLGGGADLAVRAEATPLDGLFNVLLTGTTNNLRVGIPQADAVLAGTGNIEATAVRDTQGTRLEGLRVSTDEALITADAALTSEGNSAAFTARLNDINVVVPGIIGPATARGTVQMDANNVIDLDITGAGPAATLDVKAMVNPAETGQTVNATITAKVTDLSRYARAADRPLSGAATFTVGGVLLSDGLRFDVDIDAETTDVVTGIERLDPFLAGAGRLRAAVARPTSDSYKLSDLSLVTPEIRLVGSAAIDANFPSAADIDLRIADGSLLDPSLNGPVTASIDATPVNTNGLQVALVADAPGVDVTLDAIIDRLTFEITGDLDAQLADIASFRDLIGQPVSGRIDLQANGSLFPDLSQFNTTINLRTQDLGIGNPNIDPFLTGAGQLNGTIARPTADSYALSDLLLVTPALRVTGDADLDVNGASTADIDLRINDASLIDPSLTGPVTADIDVAPIAGNDLQVAVLANGAGANIKLDATVERPTNKITGDLDAQVANIAAYRALIGQPVSGGVDLQASGSLLPDLTQFNTTVNLRTQNLAIGNPTVDVLLRGTGRVNTAVSLSAGDLSVSDLEVSTPQFSISAELDGASGAGQGRFNATLNDVGNLTDQVSGPVTARGTAALGGNGNWTIDASGTGPGGLTAQVDGQVRQGGQLNLDINGNVPLALANKALEPRRLSGTANLDLSIDGPAALTSLGGQVTFTNGRLAAPTISQALTDIGGQIGLGGGRAQINMRANVEAGGGVTISGPVALTGTNDADITVALRNVVLQDPELYTSSIDGTITVKGPLQDGARIVGRLDLGQTDIRVPSSSVSSLGELPTVRHIGQSAAVGQTLQRAGVNESPKSGGGSGGGGTQSRPYPLDIVVNAPSRIFVRGRGLDAELGGRLTVTGTSRNVIPVGRFELLRGRIDILQQRFELTEGVASLQGDFAPYIRLVATTQTDSETTINIIVEGPAGEPEVRFESIPELPQDEVLSQLIFGRDLESISPLQAVQLASAISTLAGRGGGAIDRLRESVGLDDFDVTTDEEGATAVRAGKYLSENVYTDVTVTSEGGTEVNLNLDITNEITAKGSVDQDGETSVGVFFERDY